MDHQAIVALARAQHGLVTRRQVLELGGSDRAIATLVATGRWRRSRRGVLEVGAPAATWEQRVMAACLAAGPGVV
ncbi:MAG TPA: type IV toxin-antitoxin system AbiEi family antitoxin domain-containing protein, partial [Aquihabitans sp.]|nr:type IV toxin-antitoxin system AbiEi family antitoxin domain-containing protein [Aquihabitans sp.]